MYPRQCKPFPCNKPSNGPFHQPSVKPSLKASTSRPLINGILSSFFSSGNPHIGPGWFTPGGRTSSPLRGDTVILCTGALTTAGVATGAVEDPAAVVSSIAFVASDADLDEGAMAFDRPSTFTIDEFADDIDSFSVFDVVADAPIPHLLQTHPPTRPGKLGRLGLRLIARAC